MDYVTLYSQLLMLWTIVPDLWKLKLILSRRDNRKAAPKYDFNCVRCRLVGMH